MPHDTNTPKFARIPFLRKAGSRPGENAAAQVVAYWSALAGGHMIPVRHQVDPRVLGPVLENCFILERIAPGVARFRVAGRHLGELMGLEVRGMPLTAFFAPESRRMVSSALEDCCAKPALCTLSLRSAGGLGRGQLTGEMLLAPLRDDAGLITRVLGSLQSRGSMGRQPRRFTVSDVKTDAQFPIPAIGEQARPAPAFAESAAPFDHAPVQQENAPALRLVIDND